MSNDQLSDIQKGLLVGRVVWPGRHLGIRRGTIFSHLDEDLRQADYEFHPTFEDYFSDLRRWLMVAQHLSVCARYQDNRGIIVTLTSRSFPFQRVWTAIHFEEPWALVFAALDMLVYRELLLPPRQPRKRLPG